MSCDLVRVPLSSLGKIVTGKTPPSKVTDAFVNGSVPFVTPRDLDDRKWIKTTERYLSNTGLESVKGNIVPAYSVAVSCIGSDMGKARLLPVKSVTNQQINTILVNSELHNPEYIYYVLSTQQQSLKDIAGGSATPILNKSHFGQFEIDLPSKGYQDAVVDVLRGLDSKIEINTQTNHTLEEMAQAIFKSWFVDFDPVKAKMNGEQPEGMDAATASLFPEKLVESELGLIPEGWEAGTVSCVTTAKGGYAFKSKQFIESGNPVIKIKNITSSGTVNTLDCQCVDDDVANTASRFKLSNGDLLMAMTGATVGKSGIYVSDGRDAYLNQRVARFESKVDSSAPCWFTYNLVTKDSIFEQIVGAAQGSAQPNISSKGIEQVKAVIPTHDLISKYQELVSPLYAKWISNFKENSQLSELRDTLLPKLLSGEIELGTTNQES